MALTWDYVETVGPAQSVGNTVSYFDEMTQRFFLQGQEIQTKSSQLLEGNWQELIWDELASASETADYSAFDLEHHYNGTLFACVQRGSDLVLLIYEYMLDVSSWLIQGNWMLQPDNPIKVGNVTLMNVDSKRVEGSAYSLFDPGNRIRFRYRTGDSQPYPIGQFFIEDSPYEEGARELSYSGRNRIGFQLANSTFDEQNSFSGTRTSVVRQMLSNAGLSFNDARVMDDSTEIQISFDPDKSIFEGLIEVLKIIDWYLDDSADGRLVIGDAAFIKNHVATTGIYSFSRGSDVISRSVSRQIDGVYNRVCVRKDGEMPVTLYADVPYFEGWHVAGRRTLYQDVPDDVDGVTMQRILDQLVEEMQFSGITETFTGLFRPWLQVGDVAIVSGGDTPRVAGIISEIQHEFGQNGFLTSFTVTSGGLISNPENESTVATKYINRLGGSNRQRRILDLINNGRNTLSGTSAIGATGVAGSIGPKGDPGDVGASAYQVWLSLGNVGTEQDFLASLTATSEPVGTIRLWPTEQIPGDWLVCDGQAVNRVEHAQLFSVIGAIYGAGDGVSSFNLPNLVGPAQGIEYVIRF